METTSELTKQGELRHRLIALDNMLRTQSMRLSNLRNALGSFEPATPKQGDEGRGAEQTASETRVANVVMSLEYTTKIICEDLEAMERAV